MKDAMRSVFDAEYEIDNSLGAGENQVDIFTFLRERFPAATREMVYEVAEELAARGSYVERSRIWAYAQGGC